MDEAQAKALREPFPSESIGKLPKAGTSLDYVGHAAVTDRLLQVDPTWTWEPIAFAEDGGPLIRDNGSDLELWIRLTVCGVTRYGVGTCSNKANVTDPAKQLISDALRNAAMRFGVALDLWSKEDLHAEPPPPNATAEQRSAIAAALADLPSGTADEVRKWWKARGLPKPDHLDRGQAEEVLFHLDPIVKALASAEGDDPQGAA